MTAPSEGEKPDLCPFCGGDAIVMEPNEHNMWPWVECPECSSSGSCCKTVPEAIAAWNRRPAPAALAHEAEGWVSVKERLPTEQGEYLVHVTGTGFAAVTAEQWWDGDWAMSGEYVTHWRPLPAPPSPAGLAEGIGAGGGE